MGAHEGVVGIPAQVMEGGTLQPHLATVVVVVVGGRIGGEKEVVALDDAWGRGMCMCVIRTM